MTQTKIRNTAKILLLIYVAYFGCISYFMHSHVYNGVLYVHSHPYKKNTNEKGEKQLPIESHHRTTASFFTFNQLSNFTSTHSSEFHIEAIVTTLKVVCNRFSKNDKPESTPIRYYNHRAPPFFS